MCPVSYVNSPLRPEAGSRNLGQTFFGQLYIFSTRVAQCTLSPPLVIKSLHSLTWGGGFTQPFTRGQDWNSKSVSFSRSQTRYLFNTVDKVDVALEMKQWAELATQASAAHLAHFSISSATSTISTLYTKKLKWMTLILIISIPLSVMPNHVLPDSVVCITFQFCLLHRRKESVPTCNKYSKS